MRRKRSGTAIQKIRDKQKQEVSPYGHLMKCTWAISAYDSSEMFREVLKSLVTQITLPIQPHPTHRKGGRVRSSSALGGKTIPFSIAATGSWRPVWLYIRTTWRDRYKSMNLTCSRTAVVWSCTERSGQPRVCEEGTKQRWDVQCQQQCIHFQSYSLHCLFGYRPQ